MNKIFEIILLTTFFSPCLHAEINQSSVPPQSSNILIKNRLIDGGDNVLLNLDQQNEVDTNAEIVNLNLQQNEFTVDELNHKLTGKQQRYDDFSLLAEKNYQHHRLSSKNVEEPKPVRSSNNYVTESIQLNYSPWGWSYGANWGRWPYYSNRWYY